MSEHDLSDRERDVLTAMAAADHGAKQAELRDHLGLSEAAVVRCMAGLLLGALIVAANPAGLPVQPLWDYQITPRGVAALATTVTGAGG